MSDFSLLWGSILHSSIWVKESKETRLVWITLIALKNFDGYVKSSVLGLADAAKVTPEECKAALDILLAPDPDDTSGVEEGRRIKVVPGGWQIVNNDLYRFSSDAKREFWRQQKAEQRAKKDALKISDGGKHYVGKANPKRKRGDVVVAPKQFKNKPLPGEEFYVKNVEQYGQEKADEIQERLDRIEGGPEI